MGGATHESGEPPTRCKDRFFGLQRTQHCAIGELLDLLARLLPFCKICESVFPYLKMSLPLLAPLDSVLSLFEW